MDISTPRPAGLVPGSPEWLAEIQGPKLVMRLISEIEAQPVGNMSPTGARLLGMALDRIMPSLTAVHHTGDGNFATMTDEQLKEKLRVLLGEKEASVFDMKNAEVVEFKES
ncbi:MAG: hypothetical protein V4621_07725 [Pseudomonadota bacterium]